MSKSIEVNDLNVYYSDFLAVEGVSLDIEPRSVTAFIGPSGCGKSTFLRTLNRMHEVIPGARVEGQVLLMDEPCSALDPISTLAIEDLIAELKSEYTIVIVTHNMQQAARVSDDTAFFNLAGVGQPGRLVESGRTEKIFSNPDNPATEAYIQGRFG